MKSMLKDAGILFAITLVAGLLLGCVYQITKEPIARQEALAQENACREVFSDAESFEAVTDFTLSLRHISVPTRPLIIAYDVL